MRKELDEKLCKDYPEIFKDRHSDAQHSAMCFGFEVDDGWYDMIDFLCSQIMAPVREAEQYVKFVRNQLQKKPEDRDELHKKTYNEFLLQSSEQHLKNLVENIPVATQVKEKFGGLRFYVANGTEKHHALIHVIEKLSYRVCEECGSMEGTMLYPIGWHRTLCPKHADIQYGLEALQYRNKTGDWTEGKK